MSEYNPERARRRDMGRVYVSGGGLRVPRSSRERLALAIKLRSLRTDFYRRRHV